MREESQLEDMRSAIRGDFERLVERRGEQVLMRVSEQEPVAEVERRGRDSAGRGTETLVASAVRLAVRAR